MNSTPADGLAEWVLRETSKCSYCGFCEPPCPTLRLGPHRGYGPRGRVNIARMAVEGGILTGEALASLYSCLLCAACTLTCPEGIDIPGVVRAARALAWSGRLRGLGEAPVRVRSVWRGG